MTIEEIKNKIASKIGEDPIIVSIFRTGGCLLCTNCKDVDYTVVIQNETEPFKFADKEQCIDYYVKSQSVRNKLINFEPYDKPIRMYAIDEIFKPEPFMTIYGDDTCNLNLGLKEKEYKQALKEDLEKTIFHPLVHWKDDDKYCNKRLWWAILGLMFIENKSYEVTDDMKEIIQKCHDGILEKSWEDWVKNKLYD